MLSAIVCVALGLINLWVIFNPMGIEYFCLGLFAFGWCFFMGGFCFGLWFVRWRDRKTWGVKL